MLTILAVALIVPLCIAGYLYWRVNRDFFAALEAEYERVEQAMRELLAEFRPENPDFEVGFRKPR